jgi:hypothetical protein
MINTADFPIRNQSSRAVRGSVALLALVVVGLSLQACTPKSQPEQSCNFVQNSESQRISWGPQVPVVLLIDNSVPHQYFDAIQAAAKQWNAKVGREVIKIGGWVKTNGVPSQDNQNIIYFLNTWEADRSNEQARTTVYWAGDRIYEADIRINAHDFTFFSGDTAVVSEVDFQSLVLHEMGHVLGLAHSLTPQSVMLKSLASATKRRELSASDQDSIRCEY